MNCINCFKVLLEKYLCNILLFNSTIVFYFIILNLQIAKGTIMHCVISDYFLSTLIFFFKEALFIVFFSVIDNN